MKTKKLFPVLLVVIGISIGFSVSYFGSFSSRSTVGTLAPKVLFTIDGSNFYESDFSEKMKLELYRLRNENYAREAYAIKTYALRVLLAKQNNIPLISAEPPALEKLLPLPKISDQDIDAFFQETSTEFPKDANKADIYNKIKMGLTFNKFTENLRENLQKNKRNKKLEFFMEQPKLPDIEFTQFGKFPLAGDYTSTSELTVITPFFCKTCLSTHNSIKNAVTKYPVKARIVFSYENKDSPDYVWSHAIYCLNQVSDSAFKEFYNRYNYNFTPNENPMVKLKNFLQDQVVDWTAVSICLDNNTEFNRTSQFNYLGITGVNSIFLDGKMIDFEDDVSDILNQKLTNK